RVVPRERVLSLPELVLIWRASGELGQFGRVVRLLTATGLRRTEAGDLLWSEISVDTINIGSDRMKAHRAHVVPLTSLARECLPLQRQGWPHVFGNRHDSGFSGWSKGKAQLDVALAGSVAPFRLHDIRRGVACGMADLGVSDEV